MKQDTLIIVQKKLLNILLDMPSILKSPQIAKSLDG